MISNTNKPQRVRYDIKVRRIQVEKIEDLSASLRAITFAGEDLDSFQSDGFDDHLKAFFPNQDGQLVLPQVGEKGVLFPEGVIKPDVREYTPTGIDLVNKKLRLEFAIHDAGPATSWAQNAQVGDEIGIAGPRSSLVLPLDAEHYVLIGDETALPAMRRRLTQLSSAQKAHVFAEINTQADEVPLPSAAPVAVTWAYRGDKAIASEHFLLEALKQAVLPTENVQIWLACEREQVRVVREWLLEQGYDKDDIKHASYWNKGVADFHEPHD